MRVAAMCCSMPVSLSRWWSVSRRSWDTSPPASLKALRCAAVRLALSTLLVSGGGSQRCPPSTMAKGSVRHVISESPLPSANSRQR